MRTLELGDGQARLEGKWTELLRRWRTVQSDWARLKTDGIEAGTVLRGDETDERGDEREEVLGVAVALEEVRLEAKKTEGFCPWPSRDGIVAGG